MKSKLVTVMITLFTFLVVMSLGQPMAQGKTVIKIAHENAVLDPVHRALLLFAKRVAEGTNGEVEVKVFPAGQLGDERAIYEGVKLGGMDAGTGGMYTTVDPRFSLINMPFLFRGYDHVHKVLDGAIGDDLEARAWKKGYKVMCIFDSGFRVFSSNKRPIWEPDDLKGLRLRTPPIPEIIDAMKAYGATPVSVAWAEAYTAVKQGTVDGLEIPYHYIAGMKFYEVIKYLSLVGYMYNGDMFIMNPKLWDSFSPEHKKILEEATREALV